MRFVVLGLALAGPVCAETPTLSIEAGTDIMAVSAADITTVEPGFDQNNMPVVLIRLDPGLDAQMAALTAKHIGGKLQIFVCGKLVLEPVVQSQISTAIFQISAATPQEATDIALRLREDRCGPVPSS